MINRYVEVTDEYIKQLEHEIDNLKAINENHKKINGKLREEYNKIQNLYESVFAESKKQKEVIDEIEKYIENHKRKSKTRIYGLEIPEFIFNGDIEDIEEIIQKAKGNVKNEN